MRRFILLLPFILSAVSPLNTCAQSQAISHDINTLIKRFERGRDTTYIINFWATWCAPCRKELPEFDKLTKTLSGKKVKIILLSLDSYRNASTKVGKFVAINKLLSEVILLNGEPKELLSTYINTHWSETIPATLILNTENKTFRFIERAMTRTDFDDLARL